MSVKKNESTPENDAQKQKEFEARLNADFVDIESPKKDFIIKIPDKYAADGVKKVTGAIAYDKNGEAVGIKVNTINVLEEKDFKFIAKNYSKIIKW